MFFSSSKLFLRKLLTLDTTRRKLMNLTKMCKITWTWIICLSGMMTCYLFLCMIWTLKLFGLLRLLIFTER